MSRLVLLLMILPALGCSVEPGAAAATTSKAELKLAPVVEQAALSLVSVPVTRVAVGQNIWLETVRNPEHVAASTIGDALNGLGLHMAPMTSLSSGLPRQPVIAWVQRTKGIAFRVILELEVVLTNGFLEHLISRSEAGKDHESIMSSNFDAEVLHQALQGAGFKPGKPATFLNEKRELDYKPATGDPIRIYLEYQRPGGTLQLVPAQSWVLRASDKKPLEGDWVYAGSFKGKSTNISGEEFVYFGANDGRVVCLSNFNTALLDLPFESINADPNTEDLGYRANKDAIPERGTKVRAIFEPVPKTK